jgi:hypothetical protein
MNKMTTIEQKSVLIKKNNKAVKSFPLKDLRGGERIILKNGGRV